MSDEPDDDIPSADADGTEKLYTASEVSAIVQKRLSRQPKAKPATAPPPAQPAADNGIGQLIQLLTTQVATNLAQSTAAAPPPQNARPASDRGSPAATVPLAERDLVTMSEQDRNALIKEKGLSWYRQKLGAQLKGRPIVLR